MSFVSYKMIYRDIVFSRFWYHYFELLIFLNRSSDISNLILLNQISDITDLNFYSIFDSTNWITKRIDINNVDLQYH